MSVSSVLFEVRDGVATLTLNEPERMNALTAGIRHGILDALEKVRGDVAIRALILTARGKGFCTGVDLAEMSQRMDAPDANPERLGEFVGSMMRDSGNPIVAGLRNLPVPVVCAVNGAAAGGGVGVALAADIVIAARSAYFMLPFVPRLGLVPDMGASWVLPRALGRSRAMALTLLGDRMSAQQAADWGAIWSCVDDDQLATQAASLADRLATLPALAVEGVRSLYGCSESNDLDQQIDLERERQQALIASPVFAEGVRAFHERRSPRFSGRAAQV